MKKRTKWLLAAIVVVIGVLALSLGLFFYYDLDEYYNIDGRFMEAEEIPTGMDPEETMTYYVAAWSKGDYKTMEKMWLELPPGIDSLWSDTWGVRSAKIDRMWTNEGEKDRVEVDSQEGCYDVYTLHVGFSSDYYRDGDVYKIHSFDWGNWYMVKEKEGDDWRIVERGNG